MSKEMPENRFNEARIKDDLNEIQFPFRKTCEINESSVKKIFLIHVKTCFDRISFVELAVNNQKKFSCTISTFFYSLA